MNTTFKTDEEKELLALFLNMGYFFCLKMIKKTQKFQMKYYNEYTDEQRKQADEDNLSQFEKFISRYQSCMAKLKEWGYDKCFPDVFLSMELTLKCAKKGSE